MYGGGQKIHHAMSGFLLYRRRASFTDLFDARSEFDVGHIKARRAIQPGPVRPPRRPDFEIAERLADDPRLRVLLATDNTICWRPP